MSRLARLAIAAGVAGSAAVLASAVPAAAFAPRVPAPSSNLPAPNAKHATPASFTVSTTVTLDGCGGLLTQMPQQNSFTDFSVKSASGDIIAVPRQTLTTEPPINNNGEKIWAVSAPVAVGPSDPNGPYVLSATTQAKDSGSCPLGIPVNEHTVSTTSGTSTIHLSVPPQTPATPAVTVDAKARTVSLKWAVNPEPDVVAYYVYRRVPGGGFSNSPIAVVGQPQGSAGHPASTATFVDSKLPSTGGDYSYFLAVSRAGASGNVALDAADLVVAAANSAAAVAAGVPADQTAPAPGPTPNPVVVNVPAGTKPAAGIGPIPIIPRINNAPGSPGSKIPSLLPTTTLADGTFDPTLPFDPEPGTQNAQAPNAVRLPTGGENGSHGRPVIFYVAAALLAATVAMHLLWLRREVNKVPADVLVPLNPDDDPDAAAAAAAEVPAAAGASTGLRRFVPSRMPGLSGLAALSSKLPRRRRAGDAEAEIDQWLRDDSTQSLGRVDAFFPAEADADPDADADAEALDETDLDETDLDRAVDDVEPEASAEPAEAPEPAALAQPVVIHRGNGKSGANGDGNGNGNGDGNGAVPPEDGAFAPPPGKRKLVVSIGGPRGR